MQTIKHALTFALILILVGLFPPIKQQARAGVPLDTLGIQNTQWQGQTGLRYLLLSSDRVLASVSGKLVKCSLPRPEICYEIYRPVCAVRDTGASETVTFANDCKACADPAVVGFVNGGACEELR